MQARMDLQSHHDTVRFDRCRGNRDSSTRVFISSHSRIRPLNCETRNDRAISVRASSSGFATRPTSAPRRSRPSSSAASSAVWYSATSPIITAESRRWCPATRWASSPPSLRLSATASGRFASPGWSSVHRSTIASTSSSSSVSTIATKVETSLAALAVYWQWIFLLLTKQPFPRIHVKDRYREAAPPPNGLGSETASTRTRKNSFVARNLDRNLDCSDRVRRAQVQNSGGKHVLWNLFRRCSQPLAVDRILDRGLENPERRHRLSDDRRLPRTLARAGECTVKLSLATSLSNRVKFSIDDAQDPNQR